MVKWLRAAKCYRRCLDERGRAWSCWIFITEKSYVGLDSALQVDRNSLRLRYNAFTSYLKYGLQCGDSTGIIRDIHSVICIPTGNMGFCVCLARHWFVRSIHSGSSRADKYDDMDEEWQIGGWYTNAEPNSGICCLCFQSR